MRLPPAHVAAIPAELVESLPSLKGKGPRNEHLYFATMWTRTAGSAGWPATQWLYLLALFSTLIGCIFAEARVEPSAVDLDAGVGVCIAREWWIVEAESLRWPACWERREIRQEQQASGYASASSVTLSATGASRSVVPTVAEQGQGQEEHKEQDVDADTDSLLDNANFLSFEDWKKQNLAKAGQSADAFGGKRADEPGKEDRRRPTGINNALDSLGEDAEIELEFGGFGAGPPETTTWGANVPSKDGKGEKPDAQGIDVDAVAVPGTGASHGRDAGTTCKERFNYASFDCAATVLKANPECKGSSAILTENKDSYMLNECRAKNKFLILELCDDILVDTVVLANYEFFSSIFHTFRVSVADRYPAKPDQWKELGIYEGRNTREIQAFAVENPLIWARYLKLEFLTHYGSEFFCPLSVIRVHGTTMLEEYKHEGDIARSGVEAIEAGPWVAESEGAGHTPSAVPEITPEDVKASGGIQLTSQDICPNNRTQIEAFLLEGTAEVVEVCKVDAGPVNKATFGISVPPSESVPSGNGTALCADKPAPVVYGPEEHSMDADDIQNQPVRTSNITSTITMNMTETAHQNATSETVAKPASPTKEENVPPFEPARPSTTQPSTPNPTTQESFFKSVNKRLQMLESNSTLSLLYIEEQSRILRDAFNKVEKRQLAKTSKFLENLNVTVINEIKQFREQYDQVWKSVVVEFELQRIQYHQEVQGLSSQLGVLADELVFQKRVSVIQSLMVLFCFGLVLFSRSAVSSYIEFPRVQNMMARSYSFRSSSPMYGSPPGSPGSTRPTSSHRDSHRRNLSDDSQDGPPSPTIAYSPPTPESPSSSEDTEKSDPSAQESLQVPEIDPPHFRSQSTPPVLNGSKGELDELEPEPPT